MITKTQLKKFNVSQLKDIMRSNKIKGLSKRKALLIESIISNTSWEIIRNSLNPVEKKKRIFTQKQLDNQRAFVDKNKNGFDKTVITIEPIINQRKEIVLRKRKTIDKQYEVFNSLDLLVAKVVKQSYQTKRKEEVNGLKYKDDLSTVMIAHYENDDKIIIGIHGANTIGLAILGIELFFNKKAQSETLDKVCEKLDKLIDSKKEIIVAGHSIGGFAINQCIDKNDYSFRFISFASYTPNKNRRWSRNRVRKHLFKTDWLSNNLIEVDNNCIVYNNDNINSHGIDNYLDKEKMNKELVKDNSSERFIESLTNENETLRQIIESVFSIS